MTNPDAPFLKRIPLRWKLLVPFLALCGLGSFLAWAILLTSFCSHPRIPDPATYRDNGCTCHGMTVFISPFESTMRHWLIPIGACFILLGLIAAFRALVAAGLVRINISVKITDTSEQDRH